MSVQTGGRTLSKKRSRSVSQKHRSTKRKVKTTKRKVKTTKRKVKTTKKSTKLNRWNRFLKQMKGKGLSQRQLLIKYRKEHM